MPSAGPTIASAVRTSDTSADVTWTPLSLAVARGVVTSYSVKYRSMTSQSEDCSASDASSWTAMPSTTSATSLIIVGLNPSRGYCVAVAATTSAGTGPYGTPGTIPSKLSISLLKRARSSIVLLSPPDSILPHREELVARQTDQKVALLDCRSKLPIHNVLTHIK